MPPHKKIWVSDGSHSTSPIAYVEDGKGHAGLDCVTCHGGDATRNDRTSAHVGLTRNPGQASCEFCHASVGHAVIGSQHTTLTGFGAILAGRGFDVSSGVQKARFDKQCTKCHVADDVSGEGNCGHCHVSVPRTAGGGFLSGHVFQRTPSTDNNCTACHGSRVKDEYYGLNGELLHRNAQAPGFAERTPWAGWELQPDVHKQAGQGCNACHDASEMHGVGTVPGADRYAVSTAPACEDCHAVGGGASLHHTPAHLGAMTCQVCHAQPYKNCFGCHTDEKRGEGYYAINEGDPTRAARTAAGAAKLVPGDALITFRVGLNPRWSPGSTTEKRFAVLRHVPVDRDTFRYFGPNATDPSSPPVVEGLFGDVTGLPTWKYATPHTIARRTPITEKCTNCHTEAAAGFWLTDPVADALGWIGADPEHLADEAAANANLRVAAPPMAPLH